MVNGRARHQSTEALPLVDWECWGECEYMYTFSHMCKVHSHSECLHGNTTYYLHSKNANSLLWRFASWRCLSSRREGTGSKTAWEPRTLRASLRSHTWKSVNSIIFLRVHSTWIRMCISGCTYIRTYYDFSLHNTLQIINATSHACWLREVDFLISTHHYV